MVITMPSQTSSTLRRCAAAQISTQVVIIALTLLLAEPALAQNAKKPPPSMPMSRPSAVLKAKPEPVQTVQPDFIEAQEYITKITRLARPEPRGEFETKEAYEARQPKLPDDSRSLILVERGYKQYSYDIDNKVLTIHIPVSKLTPRKRLSGLPLRVAVSIDEDTVIRSWLTNYLLFIPPAQVESLLTETPMPSLAAIPESERAHALRMAAYNKERRISLHLSAEPKDAERISKSYAVLLWVRPKGLEYSVSEATHSREPTISEPRDSTLFTRAIEVDLLEILIRDGSMGTELLRHPIGGLRATKTTEPATNAAQGSALK
jgi:hypothetical protein